MIIALFLDATVVRMLLVPAVLSLLGDAAWWAPGPLRRLQRRAALSEYAAHPAEAPGRHAASDDTVVLARIAPESEFADFSEWLADEPVSGEIVPALPAAAVRLALPAADADATEVFARFEETAVLSLPPAPTPTEDEFAAVEFRPLRAPADDADDTVPEEEPVVAATAVEPYDPDAVDAEIVGDDRVEAEFVASGTADDEPWFPAAGPYEAPGAPGRVVPADLSEWLPAVPAYETPAADWSSGDDGYYFAPSRPADGGPLALPAGLGTFDSPWQPPPPAPHDTAEPADDPDPYVPAAAEHSGTTDLTRFGPTVDLVARLGQRPESHAEPSQPAWNTTNSVSRPTDLGSYTQERRPAALGGNPAARRPSDRDDQIPPRRPPAFGDPAQLPHPPEPPMTIQPDPTTEPQAITPEPAAAEPVRRPADLADHLRESRPADLSQYTASPPRIPRMRRPDDAEPASSVRRPATLADHLSAWQPVADEDAGVTRDLRDHLGEEGDPAPR